MYLFDELNSIKGNPYRSELTQSEVKIISAIEEWCRLKAKEAKYETEYSFGVPKDFDFINVARYFGYEGIQFSWSNDSDVIKLSWHTETHTKGRYIDLQRGICYGT